MADKKTKFCLILFLIIALGFFLRIYNIDNTPPGIYPDEAVNGIDAMTANETGNYQWFYPDNQGREGLFINLQALSLKYLGVSVLSLKLPSIIIGTLTILGIFLLAKELFSVQIGLYSAFLTAVSFWHLNFSRIGFRAIMLPFILSFSFYFLWKGLRTRKWTDFATGGFVFGLGLHTYIAYRIAPAILVATLFSLILSRPNFIKEYWKKILIFILFTFLTAAPMLYTFFYAHPEYLESRSGSISIFSPSVNKGHLLQTFLNSFSLSLAKYNFFGDQNWRHNFPPYPILDTLTGISFLFGLIYSFARLIKLLTDRLLKKTRNSQMDAYVFLIVWFFAMLAPEFLTAEGNPHALRAIGTLPAVFIFSGMTFGIFTQHVKKHTVFFQTIVISIIVLMLISIGLFNSLKYHLVWTNRVETARAFEKPLMDISAYLKTTSPQKEKFIVTGSMQRIPINLFNWRVASIQYLYPNQIGQINPKSGNDFEIIMTERNDEIINSIKNRFPEIGLFEMKDSFGISYYILK